MHRKKSSTLVVVVMILSIVGWPQLAASEQGVVNINTAGVEQLSLLPRVGSVVAQRIVDFRKENGSFKALEDLMLVRGIGEKTFQLIKPYITLSGETTLAEKVRSTKSDSED
jgi:competence protein ComEA